MKKKTKEVHLNNEFTDLRIKLVDAEELKQSFTTLSDTEKSRWKIERAITNYCCYRCGYQKIKKEKNSFCNNCLEFGKVTQNHYFIELRDLKKEFMYSDRLTTLQLSSKQLQASKYISSAYKNSCNCLIDAVCGAGKTEITFATIKTVLKDNKYVCFAIPRIDILYEIAKRLEYYFPDTEIVILNSQEPSDQTGQIYVMTTNQIIKFKKRFELIIVDEVDAFPYEYNNKYDFGVQKALNDRGIIVYLTSTPSKLFKSKKLSTFKIKRRWHGFLLPVPKCIFFDLTQFLKKEKNLKLEKKIESYTKKYQNIVGNCQKQLLLFVASISKGLKLIDNLSNKGIEIPFVYAENKNRKNIIENFRNGDYPVLLTTTILERGVTFENIDVIILDSSSKMYNKAALIQIAGRVNRKVEYQKGTVEFFHTGITETMEEAIKEIKASNL